MKKRNIFLLSLLVISSISLVSCTNENDEINNSGTKNVNYIKGNDGVKWCYGSGYPSNDLGNLKDLYLDTDSGSIYRKTSEGWDYLTNIYGEDGNKGDDGKDGRNGSDGLTYWSNTILPTFGGTIIPNKGSAAIGEEIIFTFIPDKETYSLKEIEVDEEIISSSDSRITKSNSTYQYVTTMKEYGFVIGATFLDENNEVIKGSITSTTSKLGTINVTSYTSWNEDYSISKGDLFYQFNEEDIENYYSSLNLKGTKEDAFSSLNAILKSTHTTMLDYSGKNETYNNVNWANYALFDRDYVSDPLTKNEVTSKKRKLDGTIIDILYNEENLTFSTPWNGGNEKTDREHIFPKSYGFNGVDGDSEAYKNIAAGVDAHNLRMGESQGNQKGHNNRLYDELDKSTSTAVADKNNKSYSYYVDSYFMPQDEDKGEIARACLYMAVRYRYFEEVDKFGKITPSIGLMSNLTPISSSTEPSATKDNMIYYGELDTLLKWHNEDPVSENEMVRNNMVSSLQGNRNPFVDCPDLANILFA